MTSPRFKHAAICGGFLFIAAAVSAQQSSLELLPGLRERAVVLDIVARVVEQDQQEVWNAADSKVTIPGRPVGLKLVGNNVVVVIQLTPYRRRDGQTVLVAQGQIWVDIPNQGIQYQTTLQTIPLEYGEPVYFFPLGSAVSSDRARIEIQIALHPYEAEYYAPEPGQEPPKENEPAATYAKEPGVLR